MAGPWEKYSSGESSNLTAETADEEYNRKLTDLQKQYGKNVEGVTVLNPTGTNTSKVEAFGQEFDIPTFFTTPAGMATAVGTATLTAMGAAQLLKKGADTGKKAFNSIADRMLNKPVDIDRSIDIPMESRPKMTAEGPPPPLKDATLVQSGLQNTFDNALNQQVESLKKASAPTSGDLETNIFSTANTTKENFFNGVSDKFVYDMANNEVLTPSGRQAAQEELAKRQAFQGPESPFNQGPKPPEFVGPPENPMVGPVKPTVTQAIATGQNPTQALEVEVAKQIDAAPAGSVPPTKNKGGRPRKDAVKPPIPESEVGLTKQEVGMKRYLESFYGGGDVGAKTYGNVKDILGYTPAFPEGKGGGLQPEENLKIMQYRQENIAGPKVNLTHDMKKMMKAGALGALTALPGFADAAQKKQYGKMADIVTDLVVLPFAQSGELAPGTLYTPEQQREFTRQLEEQKAAERQKLGSPFRSVPPPR